MPDFVLRAIAVTPVHAGGPQFGYLGSVVVEDGRVWAVGGTHHKPTILYSADRGHTFERWAHPLGLPGIRDVHVEGDHVWVVGEWGGIASTQDHGESWRVIKPVGAQCLYTIMRGTDRRLWVLGDGGLVLRSRSTKPNAKKFERVENQSKARMLYMYIEGTTTWLLDSDGTLQRNDGRGFDKVPLKAMRTARPLCALVRTPKKTLVLLGDGGLVLRSTNDGKSWKKIPIESRNDLEKLLVTRYGIFVVGAQGSLLVSHDDGQSFQGLDTKLGDHLWSLAEIDGDLIIAGEQGKIWRITRGELAGLMHDVFVDKDPVLAGLAAALRDREEGAELVLDDALEEREML